MRAKFIFLFIVFYCNISQSQNLYTLKSSEDNSPIKYAYIYANNNILTSSDSLGIFKIKDKYLNSTIKIEALGYKTLDSVPIKNTSNILMEIKPITLSEVVLTQKKNSKKYKLGKAKNGNVGIVCTIQNNTISQVSKLFKKPTQNIVFLDKVKFKTLCSDKNRILSVFIYSVDNNGKPGRILNNEDIICNLKKGHNAFELDLSHLNITFPEKGVFIALNYIFLNQNKCFPNKNNNWYYYEPSIDAISVDNYTDSWYNINGLWKKSQTYSISMQLTVTN
ncbi:hypothetical protein ACFSQ0_07380 [Mesonia sediminis]|uniref:Carboxypeptidase-like regulatory domain-containing protein n=1 Tax=Mesonia sediminis TaxID=1703946 RepID=A0ABW5SDT5_9FLAO